MILEHTKGVCPSPGTATSTRSDWRIRTRLPLKQVAASGLPDALEFAMAALLEYCCARDGHTPLPTFNHAAAARESGCARGCKSHPSNWTVHDGTAWCLSRRKAARGVSSPGQEPMGLNEDEPQLMSPVINYNRSRRVAELQF